MSDSESLPNFDLRLTAETVVTQPRKLSWGWSEGHQLCGQVSTMCGVVRLFECGADPGRAGFSNLPPGWQTRVTDPPRHGYEYTVCPTHARCNEKGCSDPAAAFVRLYGYYCMQHAHWKERDQS